MTGLAAGLAVLALAYWPVTWVFRSQSPRRRKYVSWRLEALMFAGLVFVYTAGWTAGGGRFR